MILSGNWGELLLPGLRSIFSRNLKDLKDYVPVVFNVEDSKKAQEFTLGVGSLGLMSPWAGQVEYQDPNKLWKTTYTHQKYSKGIQIERELLDDDLYAEVKKRTRALAQSVYYTRQFYAASLFNNAFNPAYAGADGQGLCSTTHPLSPANATTWKNAGTLVLNATNLEAVRTAMKAWTDDQGNLLGVNPDTLIVAPAKRKDALVIVDSEGEPDTGDNNVNVWKGSAKVIEWDFLTNPTWWFVVDSMRMKNFLNWFDRRKATLDQDKEDFDTEVAKYKTVARFSYGWDDATFIYGNQAAS